MRLSNKNINIYIQVFEQIECKKIRNHFLNICVDLKIIRTKIIH